MLQHKLNISEWISRQWHENLYSSSRILKSIYKLTRVRRHFNGAPPDCVRALENTALKEVSATRKEAETKFPFPQVDGIYKQFPAADWQHVIWNHRASVSFLRCIDASNLRSQISSVVIQSLWTQVYNADTDMLRNAFKDSQT
jgi:hypothetical protein